MEIFTSAAAVSLHIQEEQKRGKIIGFVPTMGALHAGHLSLIDTSKKNTDITVCSIFVNPTQFNNPDDFIKYPVNNQQDIELLTSINTDILFLPSIKEIYPNGTGNLPHYDFGEIEKVLEGAYRPGHFQGVGQVMHRLLEIVQPNQLFMGQKDYQQCLIIKRLLTIINIHPQFIICPIVREKSGLAMSSRNKRLHAEDWDKATAIYQSLSLIKNNIHSMPFEVLIEQAKQLLIQHDFTIDYVTITDENLQEISSPVNKMMIALIAATIDEVRLIDNLILN